MTDLPTQLRAHAASLRTSSEATRQMLEAAAAQLEACQGDPLPDTDGHDRADVADLIFLATHSDLPFTFRVRLRQIARSLAWLEQQQQRTQEELDRLNGADSGGEVTL